MEEGKKEGAEAKEEAGWNAVETSALCELWVPKTQKPPAPLLQSVAEDERVNPCDTLVPKLNVIIPNKAKKNKKTCS